MSSSSSDSDSDDFEPVRKIKINIRPKGDNVRKGAADVSEIRASVEAWRPLGPPTHPSLSRRQSSLSSVSSMSFGMGSVYGSSSGTTTSVNAANLIPQQASGNTGMLSSPSCSSLVNEFNNRSSFTNLLGMTSRTVSPTTTIGQSDIVPVAIAIQESIELVIRGNIMSQKNEPDFSTRTLGNIKVAFPNALARGFCKGRNYPDLKFKLQPTNKITRYFLSRLIKETESKLSSNGTINNNTTANGGSGKQSDDTIDLLDLGIALTPQTIQPDTKVIEFDMKELCDHLKKTYEQSPMSKYYNVDVLRYQISPINSLEESPIQVCAYWKLEFRCVKLRIYFKQSTKSGLNLDNLRDFSFTVDLNNLVPDGIDVDVKPSSGSGFNSGNNYFDDALNIISNSTKLDEFPKLPPPLVARTQPATSSKLQQATFAAPELPARIPPPPVPAARSSIGISRRAIKKSDGFAASEISDIARHSAFDVLPKQYSMTMDSKRSSGSSDNQSENSLMNTNPTVAPRACISSEPPAQWDKVTKHLTWKFEHVNQSRFPSGGSLLAKLDYRDYQGTLPVEFLTNAKPAPVEVKFIIPESSLSNVSIDIESTGYKLSLLKREIRSGRYRSEAYVT